MSRYFNDELYHSSDHNEEEITHYGVLGMKWGIRRYQPYSYTGGSGKEVGEAKKLAKLSGKSAKLQKKIDKLEKKRTNRFAIATNARYRGQIGDKQQKLIKKKAKIDRKINDSKEKMTSDLVKKNLNDLDVKKIKKAYSDLTAATERYQNTPGNREKAASNLDKTYDRYTNVVKDAITKDKQASKYLTEWLKDNDYPNNPESYLSFFDKNVKKDKRFKT